MVQKSHLTLHLNQQQKYVKAADPKKKKFEKEVKSMSEKEAESFN